MFLLRDKDLLKKIVLCMVVKLCHVSSASITSKPTISSIIGDNITISYTTVVDIAADKVTLDISFDDVKIAVEIGSFSRLLVTPFGNRLATSFEKFKIYSLHLHNVIYEDSGLYWADLGFVNTSSAGVRFFKSATKIDIKGGPSIYQRFSPVIAVDADKNTNITISAVLQGNPKPEVTWTLNGNTHENVIEETAELKSRKYRYILLLPKITPELNGAKVVLRGTGYNGQKVSIATMLNITWGPGLCDADKRPQIDFKNNGSPTFARHACGNPPPVVRMSFDGKSVDSVTPSGTSVKDKYMYTAKLLPLLIPSRCGKKLIATAESSRGETSSEHILKYKFTPGKVTDVESYKDGCIKTTWSAPNTGECTVTYLVEYYDHKMAPFFSKNVSATKLDTCKSDVVSKVNSTRIRAISNDEFEVAGESVTVVVGTSPAESTSNMTIIIIVAVVVPVLLVILIILIYWFGFRKKNHKQDPEKVTTGSGRSSLNNGNPSRYATDDDGYSRVDGVVNTKKKNKKPKKQKKGKKTKQVKLNLGPMSNDDGNYSYATMPDNTQVNYVEDGIAPEDLPFLYETTSNFVRAEDEPNHTIEVKEEDKKPTALTDADFEFYDRLADPDEPGVPSVPVPGEPGMPVRDVPPIPGVPEVPVVTVVPPHIERLYAKVNKSAKRK